MGFAKRWHNGMAYESKGYVPDSNNANVINQTPLTKDTKNLDTDIYRHLQLLPLITYMFLNPRDQMTPLPELLTRLKSFSPLPDIGNDDAVNAPKKSGWSTT